MKIALFVVLVAMFSLIYGEVSYCDSLLRAAQEGNASAQNELGSCYFNGNGVTKDKGEAIRWYRLAAGQGNASAQFNLGWYYFTDNVQQNYTAAVYWFRLSSDQGFAPAQFFLGFCFYKAYGVKQDYQEAVNWYHMASDQEYSPAMFHLGVCYFKGRGVTQDYEAAANWYRLAAEQGNIYAHYNLGWCYYDGKGVTQDYTQALKHHILVVENEFAKIPNDVGWSDYIYYSIVEDNRKLCNMYTEQAMQGDTDAMYFTGLCYNKGFGIARNDKEALFWFMIASSNGSEKAANLIADISKKMTSAQKNEIQSRVRKFLEQQKK